MGWSACFGSAYTTKDGMNFFCCNNRRSSSLTRTEGRIAGNMAEVALHSVNYCVKFAAIVARAI